jgi:peptide deformylase
MSIGRFSKNNTTDCAKDERKGTQAGMPFDKNRAISRFGSTIDAMAIRPIIRMGHPTLRRPARPLGLEEIGNDATQQLLTDMRDTLRDAGGIGLAAPQIDAAVRLAIIEIPGGSSRYGNLERMPFTVFINPDIQVLNPARAGFWEGCLSVPGLRGFVERPQHVKVAFTNRCGKAEELELSGFQATVVQHELDHLDGKLFIDRLADSARLAFEDEYQRYLEQPSP